MLYHYLLDTNATRTVYVVNQGPKSLIEKGQEQVYHPQNPGLVLSSLVQYFPQKKADLTKKRQIL